jgi:hypothetical protein
MNTATLLAEETRRIPGGQGTSALKASVLTIGGRVRADAGVDRPRAAVDVVKKAEAASGLPKKDLRAVAKMGLAVGLGLLCVTGFGGKRALKLHVILGFGFAALVLWHASLYRPRAKSLALSRAESA